MRKQIRWKPILLATACLLSTISAPAQAPASAWTVHTEWVRAHEEFLASDTLAGRGSATSEEHLAATYVASEFIGYGLQPAPGMTDYIQQAAVVNRQGKPLTTYNAIGFLPGSDPAAGVLLLTAHLDHLGIGKAVNGDTIYNGANDDASGTTAVLELAHALAASARMRRGILFVCYGSEELGGLGSTYFAAHPPIPLKSIVANLEFEMIGTQDPKMPKGVLLFTGWERSNLGPTLSQHGALLGPDPYPEQHFFQRSDNFYLALQGVVAHTAAGWGTPPTYHLPSDDLAHLDINFMTAAIQSLIEPLRWLASSDFVPTWNPGGQPAKK